MLTFEEALARVLERAPKLGTERVALEAAYGRVLAEPLTAAMQLPPHDYKPLIEKYGDRFQMQDLDKVQPIPSGILGTIHLVTKDTK